ncbi:MAG TPA: hypothetical protein VGD65_25725 [Chryseosolibacter sp.]
MKRSLEATSNSTFGNYTVGVRSAMNLFDHTDAGTAYTYSQLLTGGNNSQIGAAKSFEVMQGMYLTRKYMQSTSMLLPARQTR